jgi:hypothetical protein
LGLSNTTTASAIATPTATTVYTVIGTDAFCNTATSTVIVNVNPFYDLSLQTSANYLCANGSTTIIANDTIYGPNVMPTGYCAAPPPTNGVGSFCITNVNIGSINNTTALTCGTAPYTNYTNIGSTNLYVGAPYTFTGTMATANGSMSIWIDWNRNGVFETTEYTSIVTGSGAGNPYAQNIIVPANALPGLTRMRVRTRVTASGINSNDACTIFSSGGESEDYALRIIKSPNTVLSIDWQPSTFLNATNTQTVISGPVTASTIYTATITDAAGCNTSNTVAINVQPLSCGVITANPLIACIGGSSTLKSHVTGGGQPYSYTWKGPNLANTNTITIGSLDSTTVTPTGATVYTLIVADACGNTCSTVYNLTANPGASINVTNAAGGAIQICGTNTNSISLKANGAVSYTWSPTPNVFVSANGDSVNTLLNNTYNYVVTGTDVNNCTSTFNVIITYQPDYALTPTATPAYVCAGGTSELKISDTVFGSTFQPTNYCTTSLHSTANTCIDTVLFNMRNAILYRFN